MSQLLKLAEVAARLNQSLSTVRRLIAERKLAAVRLSSRAWRVEERELELFIGLKRTTLRSADVVKLDHSWSHLSNGKKRRRIG